MKEVKVSVICLAYNHEAYIRDALEGFVMQQTDFAYEVLIHDDASTDQTAEIIREYERRYPDLVRAVYQSENQYSRGVDNTAVFLWPKVRGKYIAFCEGDDYWTSPHKLQKQYEALEQHPEVDICAHSSWILDADGKKEELIVSATDTVLTTEQVIAGDAHYVNTNTLMYRAEINHKIPPFRKMMDFDYTLQVHGALRGGMYYLHDFMSVYRRFVPDSITSKMKNNLDYRIEIHLKSLEVLDCIDRDTNGRYSRAVEKVKYAYKSNLAFMKNDFSWIRSERIFREQSLKVRTAIYLACKYPRVHEIVKFTYRKLKRIRSGKEKCMHL